MKFLTRIKWILILLVTIAVCCYLYVDYDSRHFLIYEALHISEKPASVKILSYETSGVSDCQYEYFLTLNKNDVGKLLAGRTYRLTSDGQSFFNSWASHTQHNPFFVDQCYTSGDLSHGLVNVFVNKDNSKAYVIYNVE